MALDDAGAPGEGETGGDGVEVLAEQAGDALQELVCVRFGLPNPLQQEVSAPVADQVGEGAGEAQSRCALGISGANMRGSLGLKPIVRGIPPIRCHRGPRRRRPAKLHADKGYGYDHLRRWLRQRGIRHRIARGGIESSRQLGRHRRVVERTASSLAGC